MVFSVTTQSNVHFINIYLQRVSVNSVNDHKSKRQMEKGAKTMVLKTIKLMALSIMAQFLMMELRLVEELRLTLQVMFMKENLEIIIDTDLDGISFSKLETSIEALGKWDLRQDMERWNGQVAINILVHTLKADLLAMEF